MRFSLIYEAQMADPSPANERQVFADIVEQSLLAEELDFDVIWAVEHTALTHYAHMSAPETFLAYLAGRIERRLYANASSPEEGLIEEAGAGAEVASEKDPDATPVGTP